MNGGDIKRVRRIAAAGLWVSVMIGFGAGSSQAAECQTCDDPAAVGKPMALSQYTKRHVLGGKKTAYSLVRKSQKANLKPPATRLSKRSTDPALDPPPLIPQDLPESVSNANAALTGGDLNRKPPVTAVAVADDIKRAPIEMVSGVQIASADQLNDIDRAFLAATSQGPAIEAPPQPAQARDAGFLSATYDDESWRRASLIGKILIAFGAVLTLGSILRMMLAHRAQV